jgi:hypothetical protein
MIIIIIIIIMMLNYFAGIVKTILKRLPKNDYPVLNTRLFVLIWLHLIFDKSLGSLRDLFFRAFRQRDCQITVIFCQT